MSERKVYNLAYGKRYIAQDKSEKKTWITVGKLFIDPESEYGERISIRLDAIPTDPNFNGLLSAFPHESRNGNGKNGNGENIEDIPF